MIQSRILCRCGRRELLGDIENPENRESKLQQYDLRPRGPFRESESVNYHCLLSWDPLSAAIDANLNNQTFKKGSVENN